MQVQDDLTQTFNQLTQQQLQAALLAMTGDLAKADVLQKRLPGWMINAPSGSLEALERDAWRVEDARATVAERLKQLRPLDDFCNEHLKAYCQERWQVRVDPEKIFSSTVSMSSRGSRSADVCADRHAETAELVAYGAAKFFRG